MFGFLFRFRMKLKNSRRVRCSFEAQAWLLAILHALLVPQKPADKEIAAGARRWSDGILNKHLGIVRDKWKFRPQT